MLGELEGPLARLGPWFYPRLHGEAGLLGQVLYLEAEAAGIRATGVGCLLAPAASRGRPTGAEGTTSHKGL